MLQNGSQCLSPSSVLFRVSYKTLMAEEQVSRAGEGKKIGCLHLDAHLSCFHLKLRSIRCYACVETFFAWFCIKILDQRNKSTAREFCFCVARCQLGDW